MKRKFQGRGYHSDRHCQICRKKLNKSLPEIGLCHTCELEHMGPQEEEPTQEDQVLDLDALEDMGLLINEDD